VGTEPKLEQMSFKGGTECGNIWKETEWGGEDTPDGWSSKGKGATIQSVAHESYLQATGHISRRNTMCMQIAEHRCRNTLCLIDLHRIIHSFI